MKYLIILFVFISLQAIAQPAFEFGASAGIVLPTNKSATGYTGSINADIVTGRFRRTFTPAFGIRTSFFSVRTTQQTLPTGNIMASDDVTWTALSFPVSVNYTPALSTTCNFRLTASAGPMLDFTGTSGNNEIYLLTEASAGLMFNKKITVGLKYSYPTGFFGYSTYSAFRVHALQLDARFMIPRGKVINNKSQWERVKERNAEMAIRHKKMKEEKRRAPHKGPHLEIGFSGGISFTSDVDNYLPYNAAVPKTMPTLMFITNLHIDKKGRHVAFTCGARIGATGSETGLGTTFGVKYETQDETTLRTSLTVGPSIYFISYGRNTGIRGNVSTELSAGTLLWHRLYVGVKYLQPLFKTTEAASNGSYIHDYQYRQSVLMADITVRLGGKY